MAQYASNQPAGYNNHIRKVALVGATGQVGSFIAHALLDTGKFEITAITRGGSAKLPSGITAAPVDYDDPSSIEKALKGHDALVITMASTAPQDTQAKIIKAASAAGVPWVIPNQYGSDSENHQLGHDIALGYGYDAVHELVESLGNMSWIDINCSFWYEFSLASSKDHYGFDLKNREVLFYDDGKEKINTSTWAQTGRAVASVLSLKVLPDSADDKSPTLSQFRNSGVRVSSFTVSQQDMFDSLKRVTGTTDADWKISRENSRERWQKAVDTMESGSASGQDMYMAFLRRLYTRVFFPTGDGNYGASKGLHNEILGLPEEDLDEATKRAVQYGKDEKVDVQAWLKA